MGVRGLPYGAFQALERRVTPDATLCHASSPASCNRSAARRGTGLGSPKSRAMFSSVEAVALVQHPQHGVLVVGRATAPPAEQ
jgi:hypothetical protein